MSEPVAHTNGEELDVGTVPAVGVPGQCHIVSVLLYEYDVYRLVRFNKA